jgi:polysaccharide biosynthesis protein PslG
MFSCFSWRLLLTGFGLLTIGVLLVGACAAVAPKNALTPTNGAAATSGKGSLPAKSVASAPAASGGSSNTAARPVTVDGSATTVYGFSADELEAWAPSEQVQQLEAMKATGVTSVRLDANWYWGQPDGPVSYDWTPLDRVISSIQKVGLSAEMIIDGCPPWAAVSGGQGNDFAQPASSAAFARWAAAVAKRYGDKGAKYFEIWNEPNNPEFWAPKPNPGAYTADLKAAYTAIKTVDPSAVVISGGLAPELNSSKSYAPLTFLEDMYADGAEASFDGVGFHPYSYPADPDTDSPTSAWSQMSLTSPSMRSIMAANGDSAKKIWITEFGAPTSNAATNVSDANQSDELVQAISQVKEFSWVGSLYIYTWEDLPDDGFGLLAVNGAQKPAYAAVIAALPK